MPSKMPFSRPILLEDDGTTQWVQEHEEEDEFVDSGSLKTFFYDLSLYSARHSMDIVLTIVIFLISLPVEKAPTVERLFRLDDPSIAQKHLPDTVSVFVVFLLLLPIPLAVIFLFTAGIQGGPDVIRHRRSASNFFFPMLGLLTTAAIASTTTNVLKIAVGRLRPDFLDRCFPTPYNGTLTPALEIGDVKWFDGSVCTNPDKSMIRSGRTSFPSGHTTDSFAGCMYLSLFLFYNIFLLPAPWPVFKDAQSTRRRWTCASFGLTTPMLLLVTLPIVVATLVGVSRVSDHRHNPTDVLAGAIVGSLSAFLGWYLWGIRGFKDVKRREECQLATGQYVALEGGQLPVTSPARPSASVNIQLEEEDEQGHVVGQPAVEIRRT